MNRPARFTKADLRRATEIAIETGHEIEIAPDGTIRLVQPQERSGEKKNAPVQPKEIVIW